MGSVPADRNSRRRRRRWAHVACPTAVRRHYNTIANRWAPLVMTPGLGAVADGREGDRAEDQLTTHAPPSPPSPPQLIVRRSCSQSSTRAVLLTYLCALEISLVRYHRLDNFLILIIIVFLFFFCPSRNPLGRVFTFRRLLAGPGPGRRKKKRFRSRRDVCRRSNNNIVVIRAVLRRRPAAKYGEKFCFLFFYFYNVSPTLAAAADVMLRDVRP